MKQGEMELKLDVDNLVLKATPHALRTILSKHEDMRTAINKVYMMNFEIMCDIVEAAIYDGKTKVNKQYLEENVFNEGIINLIDPLTQYLMLLSNGGKPIENQEELDDEKKA